MKTNPHRITLNMLIIVGCAVLYFSCSYLFAKWFVLTSGWYDKLGPGDAKDVVLLFVAYVLAAVPPVLIIGRYPLPKALRLALPTVVLAISLMVMQGYFFILLYTMPYVVSALLVLVIFMGMVALVSQMKLSCCGSRCCPSMCHK
ncbi:MAG: hypothetical protein KKD73_03300 [Proteobacteria bacterium]|nr:hypothetical protein [Pseudomonadota bacterium]MBU1640629.1 hypothetical protein [Pseudomonadota bacterium]